MTSRHSFYQPDLVDVLEEEREQRYLLAEYQESMGSVLDDETEECQDTEEDNNNEG